MAKTTNLINNTLSNLAGGVTEQYQEGRFDSQVSAMVNCMPSLTRGVLRRNPLEAITTLINPSAKLTPRAIPADLTNCFVYSYDRGTGLEQYLIVIPGDGFIHTFNANDGSHLYTNNSIDNYLVAAVGTTAKDAFEALTIGDHTFIVNSTVTTSMLDDVATSTGYSDMALYWIKKTTSVVTGQKEDTTNHIIGTSSKGYTYTLNGDTIIGEEATAPYTPVDMNNAYKIATEFTTNTGTSLVDEVKDAVCYNKNFTGSSWEWSDSFGDEASVGVWKTVDSSAKLPAKLPTALDGFIVKVSGGTQSDADDYFLQYVYKDSSGEAVETWKEIAAPGSKIRIDSSTMPHVLYRLTLDSWEFNTYQGVDSSNPSAPVLDSKSKWTERKAGGLDPIDDPSFLGNCITNIFFHKNRLGFITSDSVILSMTGDYGSFFVQTIQEVLDDDPIDLAVASTDVTILRHAVPTAGQLIIFADDTQFSLQSVTGPLTPNSADIVPLSNYTYGNRANAKSIGNRVFFANQAGGDSQLYSYKVTEQGSNLTEATPMTLHLPTYIDSTTSKIIGHDVLGYIFIEEAGIPNRLTVLTSVLRGSEELQNAFHRWTFEEDIVSTQIINNDLYILFSNGDFTKMSLEVPSRLEDTVYLDTYNVVDGPQVFNSSILFSEFFVRDKEGKGTVRGRYQLRTIKYTVTEDSRYITCIYNTDHSILDEDTMMGPTWIDTDVWDDTKIWVDINPLYTREYIDDDLVTIMSNSKKVRITFKSSEAEPSKGFELSTANIEGFFHQRSRRG